MVGEGGSAEDSGEATMTTKTTSFGAGTEAVIMAGVEVAAGLAEAAAGLVEVAVVVVEGTMAAGTAVGTVEVEASGGVATGEEAEAEAEAVTTAMVAEVAPEVVAEVAPETVAEAAPEMVAEAAAATLRPSISPLPLLSLSPK